MSTDADRSNLPELTPDSEFGPYRIVRLLGRGGMGAVYEAEHRVDGRVVALKLLSVDLDKMDARTRFLREGQTAAAINHPNTVYIYGTEEIDGTPAISMELVPGGTLDEKVKERGQLPWAEAVEDILQVIDGLDAALAAGVLHRDVKPSNCFINTDGTVKIGDFGLSKPVEGNDQLKLTQTGVFLGTPVFSSPEQLLGEKLDVRSDIYAVGVTFYSLLTGSLPYASGSMMQVVAAVLNGSPKPLSEHRTDLPANVIAVVQKAMARKLEDRYQSYAEFRADVEALRAVEVAPASLFDRFRAWFVDGTVNFVLVWIVLAIAQAAFGLPAMPQGTRVEWRRVIASAVVALFVVGIPEGLRGASIGKWLVGLRVNGPGGGPPGYIRAITRVLMLAMTDFATAGVQQSITDPKRLATATAFSVVIFHSIFLITARRRNGYRLLQDVLTGTRVVRVQAASAHRRSETRTIAIPTMSGDERRIGPYVIIGATPGNANVLQGWDDSMRRAVWVVPRAVGAAETTPARRSLSRLTRLRWVGGRRSSEEAWDAFEAPVGEPLADRLQRPVSWTAQQDWLEDIGSELLAAEQDATLPASIRADELWVTPTDRIVFPESDTASDVASTSAELQRTLVAELLERIEQASRGDAPRPHHATIAIRAARESTSAAQLVSTIQSTRGRVATVTRARRAGLMVAMLAPIAALSFLSWFSVRQANRSDRTGFLLAGLTSFVADSVPVAPKPDTARKNTPRSRLNGALKVLGVLPIADRDSTVPKDSLRHQRRLAETYISSTLLSRARDTVTPSIFGNSAKDRQRRKDILARNTTIDSTDARAARFLVDSVWKGKVPGNSDPQPLGLIYLSVTVLSMLAAALITILAALLVRRGPLLRGFQLEIVTADGTLASRWRLIVRALLSWSTLSGTLVVVLLMQFLAAPALAVGIVVCSALAAVWWLVAIAMSYRNPSRGLAERASGTFLVME